MRKSSFIYYPCGKFYFTFIVYKQINDNSENKVMLILEVPSDENNSNDNRNIQNILGDKVEMQTIRLNAIATADIQEIIKK